MPQKIDNRSAQMFDVRPVNSDGDLDLSKMQSLEKIVDLRKKENLQTTSDQDFNQNIFLDNVEPSFKQPTHISLESENQTIRWL